MYSSGLFDSMATHDAVQITKSFSVLSAKRNASDPVSSFHDEAVTTTLLSTPDKSSKLAHTLRPARQQTTDSNPTATGSRATSANVVESAEGKASNTFGSVGERDFQGTPQSHHQWHGKTCGTRYSTRLSPLQLARFRQACTPSYLQNSRANSDRLPPPGLPAARRHRVGTGSPAVAYLCYRADRTPGPCCGSLLLPSPHQDLVHAVLQVSVLHDVPARSELHP